MIKHITHTILNLVQLVFHPSCCPWHLEDFLLAQFLAPFQALAHYATTHLPLHHATVLSVQSLVTPLVVPNLINYPLLVFGITVGYMVLVFIVIIRAAAAIACGFFVNNACLLLHLFAVGIIS